MKAHPVLLLIDVQKGFLSPVWGQRNNPGTEENISKLLARCRSIGFPILHVQHLSTSPHSPLRPGQDGVEFMECSEPKENEPIIQKSVNSAFIGTDLKERLESMRASKLIVVGIATDHCVSTTVRMAANLGFQPIVVSDATATFDRVSDKGVRYPAETVHEITLSSLHGEFAEVMSSHKLLQNLNEGLLT